MHFCSSAPPDSERICFRRQIPTVTIATGGPSRAVYLMGGNPLDPLASQSSLLLSNANRLLFAVDVKNFFSFTGLCSGRAMLQ